MNFNPLRGRVPSGFGTSAFSQEVKMMSMCLHLRFGMFKTAPDAQEQFCVLTWLSDDDAEAFFLFDSLAVFLGEYPEPDEFFLALESAPTMMVENADAYYDPESGELHNTIVEGWPWALQQPDEASSWR